MTVELPVTGRRINPTLARSWLLVPATTRAALEAAEDSDVDAIIVDLEDGVPAGDKTAARAVAADWLQEHNGWVRINDVTTNHWLDDIHALRSAPGLLGVMLAKTESAHQVVDTTAQLPRGTAIIPLVESAAGMLAAESIAYPSGVLRMAFGVGDFRRDTGIGAGAMALAYARSHLVVASRAAGIAAPIDGPALHADPDVGPDGAEILRAATAVTADMGMTGKLCLQANQAAVINAVLSPGVHDLRWALAVVDRLGEDGSRVTDGSDLPQLARAKLLLAHAKDFGLRLPD